ncbi:MAG: hypothetical protein HRO68_10180 [Nitrosopumilus sp.]|nr:hypothetical protein [Nitrosopumilus sp.]
MTRWKKDETEFTVSLNLDETRGAICIVPKPVVEKLGNPKRIKFVIQDKNIIVNSDVYHKYMR